MKELYQDSLDVLKQLLEKLNNIRNLEYAKRRDRQVEKIIKIEKELTIELNYSNFEHSPQNFQNLLENLYLAIESFSILESKDELIFLKDVTAKASLILNDLEKVKLLNIMANIKNHVVIVGANGSGKSTYVDQLKNSILNNLIVIPAQKLLVFKSNSHRRDSITLQKYRNSLNEGTAKYNQNNASSLYFDEKIVEPFTFLMTYLVKEYSEVATNQRRNALTTESQTPIWDQLEAVWKNIIPDITFHLDASDRIISALKDGNKYSINGLSDGEKCILFYIGNVLLAPENSYIVVDEPETFLNPSIYNKLWDLLIKQRSDCQFIFTSHNMEFINARVNTTIVWCKSFTPPDSFEFLILDNKIDFPTDLLTELVGSRKKILFCEGSYNGYDYKIYSQLFSDDFTLKPVGGHRNVINYTESFNNLYETIGNSAIGIIDNDGMEPEKIQKQKSKNIFVLPYNEIEMLLFDEKIIIDTLSSMFGEEKAKNKLKEFQQLFFKKINYNKNTIIYNIVKAQTDYKLQNWFIDSKKNPRINDIIDTIKRLPENFSIQDTTNEISDQIDLYIKENHYFGLLQICNLKKDIFEIASKKLNPDYIDSALYRIAHSKELQMYLIDKIAPDLKKLHFH